MTEAVGPGEWQQCDGRMKRRGSDLTLWRNVQLLFASSVSWVGCKGGKTEELGTGEHAGGHRVLWQTCPEKC